MSFTYIRLYFSVVDNNRCPISIYSRFLIALFVLGIGLTASVIIKQLPQNQVASKTLNHDEESAPVKGALESFPRDFTLNSSDPVGSYRFPIRNNAQDSKPYRHTVGMPEDQSKFPMGKKYPGDDNSESPDSDEKPSLSSNSESPNSGASSSGGVSEDELLKFGYIRHRTRNGDCLRDLAEQYLHDINRWTEIYELNRSKLTNKDVIPIGIVLIIPAN